MLKMLRAHCHWLNLCVALTLMLLVALPAPAEPDQELVKSSLAYLGRLQDSSRTGLVPLERGKPLTTTYVNAAAALAFVLGGKPERARRIFDVFAGRPNECPCACSQGFQQFRSADTGGPNPTTDCWVGDNAWLLTALKVYRARTGDHRYDALTERLKGWLQCLKANSPEPGIIGGFRPPGCAVIAPHPEGSIDVYGALYGLNAEPLRASILQWINQQVWIPHAGCFERGPANQSNLPTDHSSWGYLALATDHPEYKCILSYADHLNARAQDRYLIEAWDRDGLWNVDRQDPSIQVQLTRVWHGSGHNLDVGYTIPAGQNWFRVYRFKDVDFQITPAFRYDLWVQADGPVPQFEVKLSGFQAGPTCIYSLPLTPGWQRIEVPYERLRDFATGGPCVGLNRVGQVELAVNNFGQSATDRHLQIGSLRYGDGGKPYLFPVDGFAAFESDTNWLFVEGTGQMATAYCVAGRLPEWRHYMGELSTLAQMNLDRGNDRASAALPFELTGSEDNPAPNPVATSWFIIASYCVNPFAPRSGEGPFP